MGSRGRRDRLPRRGGGAAALRRAGEGETGIVYTRTGRRFFDDAALEAGAARRGCATALTARGPLGASSRPTGCCLDCELMPWSAKAQELLRDAVRRRRRGRPARRCRRRSAALARPRRAASTSSALLGAAIASATETVEPLRRRLPPLLLAGRIASTTCGSRRSTCWRPRARSTSTRTTSGTWRRWPRLLRRRSAVCCWRRRTASSIVTDAGERGGGIALVGGADRRAAARAWSSSRSTSSRAGRRGLVQPAVKCRGREYLRIIYGPEYTDAGEPGAAAPARPGRASARSRCASSRSASRRWSASSRREPLRRVHECVFGVLALESEPVDPTL